MKIKIILFFTLLLLSSKNFSQTPNWIWSKSSGGSLNDDAMSTATDKYGNVFVTGRFESSAITFDTNTFSTPGQIQMYVVKYDANGNVIWAMSPKGAIYAQAFGLTTDTIGNVYVTGFFAGDSIIFGADTIYNTYAYSHDVFAVKMDNNGNTIWAKGAGGVGDDLARAIAVDNNGNVFITGEFSSPSFFFGTTTLTLSPSAGDTFIIKYDAVGNPQWAISSEDYNYDSGLAITSDLNGNCYVTRFFNGSTISFGSITLTSTGAFDIYILKLDPLGNVLWAKNPNGSNSEKGTGITTDKSGNVYVTGFSMSTPLVFGSISLPNSGYTDFYVVKYDPLGNALWARRAAACTGNAIKVSKGGLIYSTGFFDYPSTTFGSITLNNTASRELFVVCYDTLGIVKWAKNAIGSGQDEGMQVAIDNFENVYVAGKYNGPYISFGSNNIYTSGGYEMFLAKLALTTDIDENSEDNTLTIFPNPFSTEATILFRKPQKQTSVKILDVLGKEVKTFILNESTTVTINRESLVNGIYFVQIIDEHKKILNKKIIIQ